MPREWTERHIRELVDAEYKVLTGGGAGLTELENTMIQIAAFFPGQENFFPAVYDVGVRYVGLDGNRPKYQFELRTESVNFPATVPVIVQCWDQNFPTELTFTGRQTGLQYTATKGTFFDYVLHATINGDFRASRPYWTVYTFPGEMLNTSDYWVSNTWLGIGNVFGLKTGNIN